MDMIHKCNVRLLLFPNHIKFIQSLFLLPLPLLTAFVWGDPHLKSLDGFEFWFNGHGEYTLIKNREEFTLQGRFSPWVLASGETVRATAITGLVAQQRGQPIIEFILANDNNGK